jgi:Uma2 family endonuclease
MSVAEPRPYRWTGDEYYKLCEADWFQGKRVQLIGGEIIEMAAQKNEHGISIKLTEVALDAIFGPNFWVRTQMSLDLSPHSVPDPDLAVVPGTPRSYTGAPVPTTALLVVEVSETTLSYDRSTKASLYAAAGISDYWIINLVDRQVEVYRDPVPDPSQPFGYRYASDMDLVPGDVVSPLALPTATVAVDDLLP